MKKFRVEAPYAAFPVGTILGLNADQVRRRAHLLEEIDTGVYRIKDKPTGFKRGEIVQLDPDSVHLKGLNVVAVDPPAEIPAQEPETETEGSEATDGAEGPETDAQDATDEESEDQAADDEGAEQDLDEVLDSMTTDQMKEALAMPGRNVKLHHNTGHDKIRETLKEIMGKELAAEAKE